MAAALTLTLDPIHAYPGPRTPDPDPGPQVGTFGASPDMMGLGGNPFSPSLHALPSADDLFDSLPIDLLNPDELMSGVDALAHEPMTPCAAHPRTLLRTRGQPCPACERAEPPTRLAGRG